MTKMNLQTRIAKALEKRGQTEVTRRPKYIVFTRTAATLDRKPTYYYLGKAGSLRFGVMFTESIPVAESFKVGLLFGDLMERYGVDAVFLPATDWPPSARRGMEGVGFYRPEHNQPCCLPPTNSTGLRPQNHRC